MGIFDTFKRKKPQEVAIPAKPAGTPATDDAPPATPTTTKHTSAVRWQVGDTIHGRYQVFRVLGGPGESATGIVYICYDHKAKEPLALKTFQNKYLRDQPSVDRFKREAQAWVELGGHHNIVKAKGVEEIDGKPYILLEYVVGNEQYGTDLSGWIRGGGLTSSLTVNFAIQFCRGMIHAHRKFDELGKHFVHLGIKPQNIMVTWDSVVKVTDFGMVNALTGLDGDIPLIVLGDESSRRPSLTKSGNICGTPPYMSPEQCRSDSDIDTRSDIYAFGCVLYEMLTRRYVFQGKTLDNYIHNHLNTVPEPPRVNNKLDEIVLKCLEKAPPQRYQDFEELEEVLSRLHREVTGENVKPLESRELGAWELANKGVALTSLGFNREAIDCYTQALKVKPDYAGVHNLLGNTYKAGGSLDKAIAEWKEVLRIDSERAEVHVNLGDAYKVNGDLDEAIKEYREALRINPNDARTHCSLGDALNTLGKLDEASAEWKEALKTNPDYAEAHVKLGIILKSQGKIDEAIEEWTQALRTNPNDAEMHHNLGIAYKEQDKLDDAIREWKEALRVKPENIEANLNLGNAYTDQKKFDEAIKQYKAVLLSNDKDARAIHNIAIAYKEQGKLEEAIKEWKKISDSDAEAHYNLGVVYCEQGKLDEAIVEYQQALKMNPKYVNARYNLGVAFANRGNLDNAIRELKEALALDPKLPQAHYNLATAYKAQGMYEKALRHYEAFVESASPEHSSLVVKAEETINRLKQRVKERGS